ncbi:zinc knuckle CX2CX4HX4C containing protein [Tanacetum coccineum]
MLTLLIFATCELFAPDNYYILSECAISNFNQGSTFCKISMLHIPPENNEFEGEIIPCSDFSLGHETDIQEKEQKESQTQTNPSTGRKGPREIRSQTAKRWVADSPQELSIPRISSKRPLSKGIARLPRPQSSLKIFTTSSKKETNHYTMPGSGIMTCYTSALLTTSIVTKSKNIRSSSNDNGLAALVNKLDNLGQDMKKLKESVHAIQVGCQICEGPHLDKDCPLNKEVKQVEEVRYGEFGRRTPFNGNNGGKFRVGPTGYYTKTVHHMVKGVTADHETSKLNKLHGLSFMSGPESDTPEVLQHQLPLKELNPGSFTLPCTISKFIFYAMADLDMSKKAPLGIVENVLVKIDKFLFPSDFIIIDNTPSETTILGRPFLATIHAEIDVFTRKFSLGINEDKISLDTARKDHNYTNPSNWDNRSPNLDDQNPKKRKINLVENVPRAHFYNPIKHNIKEQTQMWPSCDPKKMCDGGVEICEDNRYAGWCDINPSSEVSSQESNKPRPRDYTFREWTLIKVGHTDISKPMKKALLKLWLIDCFQDDSAIANNPTYRSFDDYKWEFNLEIDKLADEYELGIGKKGHILDNICEYCNQVHNKNYRWHNHEFENDECEEIGIEDKDYHPPEVQVETFKIKKYSFEGGQSFICVTKDLDNVLPLGRKNGSEFKEMIRKEVENNKT